MFGDRCRHCGSENMKFLVSLNVEFAIDDLHLISKKTFRKKSTVLHGTSWDHTLHIYCIDCGHTFWNARRMENE